MVAKRQRRLPRDEIARRGRELYERQLQPLLEPDHYGRIVAIDVESGAYEIADDVLAATTRLIAGHPNAQPWIVRIGYRAVHRIGSIQPRADT